VKRSDRKSVAQRRLVAVGGCRDSARRRRCCDCCAARDLELVSRSLGVTAATLTNWRDAFIAGGEAALTTKPTTGEELENDRLKTRLGAALIARDLLSEKIALLETAAL
jgi:transposase